jgi:nitrate reductase alpha subunit
MAVERREFLKMCLAAGAYAVLPLRFFRFVGEAAAAAALGSEKFVRSTCSPNDTGACGYLAQVVDGRIATLIQAADYPEQEYNPRGCLRGLSMINLIYGKDRLKYPLIRTGERGSGQFRKATWEEALDYTAQRLKEIMATYGPEAVGVTVQVGGTGYVHKGAFVRLAALANWSIHHAYDQNGDLPMFFPMTFGVQTEELESLEWPNARYTMVFGSNVVQTRVPDAQHLLRAKINGKLVVFDPDYCSTAAKADEWVSCKADTDAALGLGMAKVIIDRRLYDAEFLRDFTDMPILVRKDTGKRLLAGEVKALAGEAARRQVPEYRSLLVIHTKDGFAVLNPERLDPTGADLEGEYTVELTDGRQVQVRTVFTALRELLAEYTLDKVAAITEVPAAQLERLAVEAATRRPVHVIYGASNYQWYHGDLKGRALALLPSSPAASAKAAGASPPMPGNTKSALICRHGGIPRAASSTGSPTSISSRGAASATPNTASRPW